LSVRSIAGDAPVRVERASSDSRATLAQTTLAGVLGWKILVGTILIVILFVPSRQYTLPSSLPFHAEPYRVVVAVVLLCWVASLLVDPRVRLRRTRIDVALLGFVAAALASLVVNHQRASAVAPVLTKQLALFAAVILLVYVIASVISTVDLVFSMVKILVTAGAVIALAAIVEARTGFNVFHRLDRVFPFLETNSVYVANVSTDSRGSRLRALASSQHPIELGAVLVMLMPLAFSLACATGRRRWWFTLALFAPAMVGALSRTAVPMLFAVVLVALWLRKKEVVRLWPALVPVVVLIHFAVPGMLGGLTKSFFPQGGLISQQSNAQVGSGRIATLGPTLSKELAPDPILGVGFQTRITTSQDPSVPSNAPILDNQWLGTLLETGIVGFTFLLWVFIRFIRHCGKEAKDDRTLRGWLLTGITASVAAAMVGMLTFDAFSFIQLTFVLFTLFGLGVALLNTPRETAPVPGQAPLSSV
jgi:hypothetical protein